MGKTLFDEAVNGAHTSESAGTEPAARVHPEVVEVMREVGIELSGRKPQLLTADLAAQAEVVVTMGCGDACPFIPGKRYIDWDLPDPNGLPLDEVRAIREEINQRVESLAADLSRDHSTSPS